MERGRLTTEGIIEVAKDIEIETNILRDIEIEVRIEKNTGTDMTGEITTEITQKVCIT